MDVFIEVGKGNDYIQVINNDFWGMVSLLFNKGDGVDVLYLDFVLIVYFGVDIDFFLMIFFFSQCVVWSYFFFGGGWNSWIVYDMIIGYGDVGDFLIFQEINIGVYSNS